MKKSKLLIGFVLLLCVVYAVFQFIDYGSVSTMASALIVPSITLMYFLNVKSRSFYFTAFLVLYSISELLVFISPFIPIQLDYYIGNTLYISAYICLIYEILKSMSLKLVLKNFSVHLVVLSALSAYIVYVLLKLVSPLIIGFEFVVEFVYNLVTLLLLSVALLNYIYRDTKKSLLMFFGALCIVFSEVIQIAYFYISARNILNFSYTVLLIVSFFFFYMQSKIEAKNACVFVNLKES